MSIVPPTIVQSVYEAIRTEIVSGTLKPGDPLVEAVLSEHFGTSKTPVREALIRLRRDGLVESAPHRMTRVVTPTESDIRQVCQLREWIETQIWAEYAQEPAPDVLASLAESIEAAESALDDPDVAHFGDSIRDFTDVMLEATRNRYAAQALQRLRNILDLIGNISRETPGRLKRSVEEHRAILEALEGRDPQRTAEAVSAHLRSIARDSIEAVRHLATERTG
jgi:GntR family transcriptional regulator, rspAB operon transcriptional repressor